MFCLIKQVFIVLLSCSISLARDRTKCLFINDGPCMVRPNLTGINSFELKCYPFTISLNKGKGSFNVLTPKISVPKKKKKNPKVFNMITNKTEAKAVAEHISCDFNWTFNSTTCNPK